MRLPLVVSFAYLFASVAYSQTKPTADELRAAYARARGAEAPRGRVYKERLRPNWIGAKGVWYRNELPRGEWEFVLVDITKGKREAVFDHAQLAAALKKVDIDARAVSLPVRDLAFDLEKQTVAFEAGGKWWQWDRLKEELTATTREAVARVENNADDGPTASEVTGEETNIIFVNKAGKEVELFWLDTTGRRQSYGKLAADARKEQHTFSGHVWEAVDGEGKVLGIFTASVDGKDAVIDGTAQPPRRRRPMTGRRPGGGRSDTSPDGKYTATIRDFNLVLRQREEAEKVLTTDGSASHAYGLPQWSPDSTRLVAFQIEPGEEKETLLLESSPRDNGARAVLHTRQYPLPGDKFTSYRLCIFDAATGKQVKTDTDPINFGSPRLRWNADGHTFTYEQNDRGHQRFRLVEVDAASGNVRNLIDEKTETFIWTAHREEGPPLVTWLDKTNEIIHASERDGWRHLYLVNATAEMKQITKGEFVVRGIERIDEDARQIWFRASGNYADQDPYFIHFYRINFDGSGLVALTAGDGNHSVQFSPDRQFIVDTYSRVDLPPKHELRRTSDGSLVCELEAAESSELARSGWRAPEVFSAKGRDGQTDIWGIICRPRNFDPEKKYPVIEHIYAGPHDSHVPKTFSAASRFASLTELGFIVVQIDGMGTANRSKAFHDVCWHNLKDAGLPDRVLWHKAVAAKYSHYDITRVGIYGGSAGGQNSTGALLFQPDFYKVAVSGCGCHDNRMDKASWNEQWMGYPVGPHYAASSNIDNAHRLKGKLLLIVGEMDTNVPPESTLRVADRLIKANKDFDLLVVPGAGHGMGGSYGHRRMQDFFVRHLIGVEPPGRN